MIEEVKQLYAIALPMIITSLLIYGKSSISMFSWGNWAKKHWLEGRLSIGIANITGYYVISGLAMGMEAISSQALLWLNMEPIFCFAVKTQTQNITLPLMLSAAFALVLHAPINYILVYHLGLGIQGVAVAVALTDLILLLTVLFYLCFSGICDKTWKGWSLQCFDEWKPIVSLAIPSCISVCLEWWWYELIIVLSGLLTNASDAVATTGIIIQATSHLHLPFSLGLAVSARVGNELGANGAEQSQNLVAGLCELGNYLQTHRLRGVARERETTLGANITWDLFYGVGSSCVCHIHGRSCGSDRWMVQAKRAGQLTGVNVGDEDEDEEESKIKGVISVMVGN
ncbi:ATP-dependent RNA helicase eIF4A isoform 1 [Hibiscus syriacus]|uniref:ATP-dependent RNA helicase eIF4A isoform 1 n=1 Tax=Hibiscus syriacus TaxID=106335 RepID=A0A6A3AAS2_HIBSY|nr:ATP-dependent RNA helicase eIF4A isoform 1 [Hibiscus syriacus]